MIGHLDIGILKVVMDQVDLTIKELSLDAVLAPSPVSVDIGEPVVLVVKRPVGDDQLVVPRHLHLPAEPSVPHHSRLGTDHGARKGSRAPRLRICSPDGSVEEGDGAQVRILLGALQVDRRLHWLARVGALTNHPNDLLVVEADVGGEEALGRLLLSSGRRRGAVANLVALPIHIDAGDGELEGAHLPHHLINAKSHWKIAHHPSTHSLPIYGDLQILKANVFAPGRGR